MAVVEASAAVVCIKTGSRVVVSGQGPDTLQGIYDGLRRFCYDRQMQLRGLGHDAVRSPVSTADFLGAEPVPFGGVTCSICLPRRA